jgi:hypothetical protein
MMSDHFANYLEFISSEIDRLSDAAILNELAATLGLKLTALIGDCRSISEVRQWIATGAPIEHRANLVAALQATRIIVARSGPSAAQRWFLGSNRYFGLHSPVLALRTNSSATRARLIQAAIAFAL